MPSGASGDPPSLVCGRRRRTGVCACAYLQLWSVVIVVVVVVVVASANTGHSTYSTRSVKVSMIQSAGKSGNNAQERARGGSGRSRED